MGFVDKIREVMNAPGDDDYEYEDDFEETTDDSDFVNDYSERSEKPFFIQEQQGCKHTRHHPASGCAC